MNKQSVEITQDQGLLAKNFLQYNVFPCPKLFDYNRFMAKPDKSVSICVLEKKLECGDFCYHQQHGSAFLINVLDIVLRVPLVDFSDFSTLLTKFI